MSVSLDQDFQILAEIGEGSYSRVYKVIKKNDRQIYAVKKVKLLKLQPKEKQNAINQVQILQQIQHPNIIHLYQTFYDIQAQSLCMVMEYCEAGDLSKLIKYYKNHSKPIDQRIIWKILVQVTNGLKELHNKNILHRDIKPANIFITKNYQCKLADFNVSKYTNNNGMLMTQTGTPYYACPQVWKEQPYDTKSDMWSLGCVLYQSCNLRPPFVAQTMMQLRTKVIQSGYPKINQIYSKQICEIIYSMLNKYPSNRPSCHKIMENKLVQQLVLKDKKKKLKQPTSQGQTTKKAQMMKSSCQKSKTRIQEQKDKATDNKLVDQKSYSIDKCKYSQQKSKNYIPDQKTYSKLRRSSQQRKGGMIVRANKGLPYASQKDKLNNKLSYVSMQKIQKSIQKLRLRSQSVKIHGDHIQNRVIEKNRNEKRVINREGNRENSKKLVRKTQSLLNLRNEQYKKHNLQQLLRDISNGQTKRKHQVLQYRQKHKIKVKPILCLNQQIKQSLKQTNQFDKYIKRYKRNYYKNQL